MSYLVLARRLRPQRFAEVLGQEHVTASLQSALTTGRLAHAYLFCGARGVGKTTVARLLARALNCQKGPSPEPCGECPACQELASGQAVDFLEIDGASNRGIGEIRELRENVRYLPAHGRYKVYLIDEVHMLTEPAFNALLKTLEEPPPHVVFIFATTAPQKVPATILSRCQRYDFKRLPEALIAAELARICQTEGRELEPEAAALIAREAEGSMRDALSLLEQALAACPAAEPATAASVTAALGLIDRGLVLAAFEAVAARDAARLLGIAADLHAYGQDAQQFCQHLLQLVRDALAARLLAGRPAELARLARATPEELAKLSELAQQVSQETLQLYFDILMEGIGRIRRASHPRLALEMTLLRLATLEPAVPLDDLLARLARIEERLSRQGTATGEQQGLFAAPAAPSQARASAEGAGAAPARVRPEDAAKPEAAAQPEAPVRKEEPGEAGDSAVLDRVRAFAQERDGILFAALGGARLEGKALVIPPGFFAAEDLKRRASECLAALGLSFQVRLGQAAASAAASAPSRPRPATLQDVYDIFGGAGKPKER